MDWDYAMFVCHPLQHEYQFELTCIQKNLKLFELAESQNDYPSGKEMIFRTIYVIGCTILDDVLKKIAVIVIDIFSIILISCKHNEHCNGVLAARLLRLFVIDPAQLLTGPLLGLARISLAAFGIFYPSVALSGWIAIERLELKLCEYKLNALKCVAPKAERYYKTSEIKPNSAVHYLGQERARKLHLQEITICRANKVLEQRILDSFGEFLIYLSNNHQSWAVKLLKKKLYARRPDRDYILPIDAKSVLDYLSEKPKVPFSQFFKKTSFEQLNQVYCFISGKLENEMDKSPGKFDQEALNFKMNKLKDLFSSRLSFGRVSHAYVSRNSHYPFFI